MLETILALLIIIGAFFTLVGSIGLYKLPDFYMRLHGPTKATTLGVGAILVASALYFSFKPGEISLHEILVMVFLFITAPVSAHLMAKAAIHIKLKQIERTKNTPYQPDNNN
ncbi:Na+/H+ antiporter subunit G [Thiomicrospira sp. R3]|uniref:Na+/H+ antiporter subunit G n=1 Tax=Thiomicrospira sp. R3 TaxID=3035472 RepID=UPI00259B23CD|nr:Na+/H+ antiporter subunit G [Thiomicrospira sp. R3]WFE67700.1 Na+/H+ antiporter subunit G [Thiomicrospira sp. R3]